MLVTLMIKIIYLIQSESLKNIVELDKTNETIINPYFEF